MRNLVWFMFTLLLVVFPRQSSASSIVAPASSTELKQALKLVGETRFKVLFWDIYDSQLLTKTGTYDEQQSFMFEITYLKNISSEDLIERTVEQWQHIGIDAPLYETYLPKLAQFWPDIKKGDSLTMWVDEHSTAFYFNQELVGTIADSEFGNMFSAIWLSPKTSQPKLRKELLGLN
ncbi:chalcone isomerase family protein [Thalassotalea euphylliae]|uniref:chalcone isomerase family protein n=1 Tax=Thalassotalea euphylliae TaxID=1655234 RepID=UPI003643F796